MNQVTVPAGFHQGTRFCLHPFADGGAGKTCAQLIEEIESLIAINSPRAPNCLRSLEDVSIVVAIPAMMADLSFCLQTMSGGSQWRMSQNRGYLHQSLRWNGLTSDIPFNQSLTELIAVE